MAYQGFGSGIAEDGAVVRRFVDAGGPLLVSNSFSKSFSLYGERVGALSVVAASSDEAARLLSQLKRVVRTNYSNPPLHGGKVVATVLATPELRQLWEDELAGMRVRIKEMREALVRSWPRKRRAATSLRARAGRHVLVFGPHQGAGRQAARGIDLCRGHGPHLRCRAEFEEHRSRR
jgi:aromatic-amino-acid transaminase